MRIKRTFAPTMRDALQLVKQEQGADAVILGNKKVPGGVEILSAIDFDEATRIDQILTYIGDRVYALEGRQHHGKLEVEFMLPDSLTLTVMLIDKHFSRLNPGDPGIGEPLDVLVA